MFCKRSSRRVRVRRIPDDGSRKSSVLGKDHVAFEQDWAWRVPASLAARVDGAESDPWAILFSPVHIDSQFRFASVTLHRRTPAWWSFHEWCNDEVASIVVLGIVSHPPTFHTAESHPHSTPHNACAHAHAKLRRQSPLPHSVQVLHLNLTPHDITRNHHRPRQRPLASPHSHRPPASPPHRRKPPAWAPHTGSPPWALDDRRPAWAR